MRETPDPGLRLKAAMRVTNAKQSTTGEKSRQYQQVVNGAGT
jgi:hypothetical protein